MGTIDFVDPAAAGSNYRVDLAARLVSSRAPGSQPYPGRHDVEDPASGRGRMTVAYFWTITRPASSTRHASGI
jgi:hypothetical protein